MQLIDRLVLRVRCASCRQENDIPLAHIVMSQEMLSEGCRCRGESECPPIYFAGLIDRASIEQLAAAWQRLAERASSQGGEIVLVGGDLPETRTGRSQI